MNRTVAVGLLTALNQRVTAVTNGREAIDILRDRDFELVFMDISMPEMDGIEATWAIRRGEAGERARSTPIVFLTAHALAADRERCLDADVTGYLTKPLLREELRRMILLCVDGEQLHRPAGTTSPSDAPEPTFPFDLEFQRRQFIDAGLEHAVDELLSTFVQSASKLCDRIDECLAAGDYAAAAAAAHTLKGAAATVGAPPVYNCAAEVEAAVRLNDGAAAARCLSRLRGEVARTEAAIIPASDHARSWH